MSIKKAIVTKIARDVHRVAPDLNSGFVHQTVHKAIHGVGPLPSAASMARKQRARGQRNSRT